MLVEVYDEEAGVPVWHFDLYRIQSPEEICELGLDEALAEGICLIEWPERLGAFLPAERLDLALAMGQERYRAHSQPVRLFLLAKAARGSGAVIERATHIERFLSQAGWSAARREPLPGDASFRRYVRLFSPEKRRALLMDAAPPQENVRAYLAVARLLRGLGLGSPAVFNQDAENGLLLIEDLGDDTYTRLLAQGEAEEPLYALAVDVLIELTRRFKPKEAPFLPHYDDERLLNEAALLVDWYLPAITGKPTDRRRCARSISICGARSSRWRAACPRRWCCATITSTI